MPRSYVFAEYGGPETQEFSDRPKQEPGPGELLVAVRAAGVNPVDWKLRAGYLKDFIPKDLPAGLGQEVAGFVEALGEGVVGFREGDEVFGAALDGGFAEFALVGAAMAAHKPAGVSFVDAATLTVAAATAYDGLEELALRPDQTLLVTGVGGGVGIAAAQIARGRGVRVVGTASPAKKDLVESLGVVHVPYGAGAAAEIRAVAPDGVDGIYDLVGGDALDAVADLRKARAKLITAADPMTAARFGGSMVTRAMTSAVLVEVARLAESGVLKAFVTQVFPLDQAADALAVVESGHSTGKVVIEVGTVNR